MKYNDIDMVNWKESDINTDSLWIIDKRKKVGKHKNIYHGNFIPQIPNQLIRRYTKENEVVFEPFMGSGTTLFECEELKRKYIGFDINPEMIKYVKESMQSDDQSQNYYIGHCDSSSSEEVQKETTKGLEAITAKNTQFVLMHPPYMDIIKFTSDRNDLSQFNAVEPFIKKFLDVCENSLRYLDTGRYFAVVIGDIYQNQEIIPLSFYVMDAIKKNFPVKLKGSIVKNVEGSRGKLGVGGIWRYRALNSDYYIFKHEYIFVFKKERFK